MRQGVPASWIKCDTCRRLGTWWELNSLACTRGHGCALALEDDNERRQKMNPDTIDALDAAGIDESELIDMLRSSAALWLRRAAIEIESDQLNAKSVESSLFEAVTLIGAATKLEAIWEREHPDDADLERDFAEEMRRATSATEATPHTTPPASPLRVAESGQA